MHKSSRVPPVDSDLSGSDGYYIFIALIVTTAVSTLATMVGVGLANWLSVAV